MKNLGDYIVIVDDAIPESLCNDLISMYDKCDSHLIRSTEYYSFSEVNITDNKDFKDLEEILRSITHKIHDSYVSYTNATFTPPEHGYEQHRMKKYEPNDVDQFNWHTDVGDYNSARRYLAMFYYLNTVEEGGETVFDLGGNELHTIKAKQGRVVCFPPGFMYPHMGSKPISGPKYIISTYGHYL
jgi:prolyl 4-hydroxylase